MKTQIQNLSNSRQKTLWFWIAGLAFLAGLVLSILSWLELCVKHCSVNQNYQIFGISFSIFGMVFFTLLTVAHFSSFQLPLMSTLTKWMIASALGAETIFIGIQHYQIGHWCPICISIASTLIVAATAYFISSFQNFYRGTNMKKLRTGFSSLSFFVIGLLLALFGITKIDPVEAAVSDMKNRLAFGQKNSQIEVYFVTDWFCPSCKKVESKIEKLMPKLQGKVAFYFVDFPIHRKSLNFTPYNLAFIVNNKAQYFRARKVLSDLAEENESPTDEDIAKAAKKANLSFKELPYLDVKTGMEFFEKISDKYKINATPTIIVVNSKKNKVETLEGLNEISDEKILNAIEKVSK